MPMDTLLAFVAVYNSVDDAEADYQLVKDLHTEADLIDAYDAAVVERQGGKTRSPRSTRRRHGRAECSVEASDSPPGSSSRCFRSRPSAADCSRA